jgi:hypothetical protein
MEATLCQLTGALQSEKTSAFPEYRVVELSEYPVLPKKISIALRRARVLRAHRALEIANELIVSNHPDTELTSNEPGSNFIVGV